MRPIYHMTDSTPRETPMGKVLTMLTVINRADQIRAKDGTIAAEKVRSVDLVNVLVDTGATTLCLPKEVIEKLGLSVLKEVEVMTAMGIGKARIFEDARLVLCGREGTFECLELPEGGSPLLGVIPLEMLGLEPDLQSQTLRVLPSETVNTYLTIL
jgi:clan AA aspartic protease